METSLALRIEPLNPMVQLWRPIMPKKAAGHNSIGLRCSRFPGRFWFKQCQNHQEFGAWKPHRNLAPGRFFGVVG